MGSASITFSYTDDPFVRMVLKEFHVYPVGANHVRLAPALIVAPSSLPTAAAPLIVPLPEGSAAIEVLAVNLDGMEGAASYLEISPLPSPPPTSAPHMMMLGQTRYLHYEISPGCTDCGNVFPQGLDLLRLHDAQCSFFQIATQPGVYDWDILDANLDSCEKRGVKVLYTFSYTPEWAYRTDFVPEWPDSGVATPHSNYPPRLDEFEKFFRALLDHVKRPDGTFRIQYFEAWNETNALAWWNGTDQILMEQQQMLWRVLQEVAPDCQLTTPTPTRNFTTVPQAIDTYLSMGFQNYAHIVSFHGYWDIGSPAAAIGPTLEAINGVMAKYNCAHPLWDTEFNWTQGYADDESIPMSQVPDWMEQSLMVRLQYGLACAIWFQWDSPNGCGYCLTDPQWKGQINPAGEAWRALYNSIHPLPAVLELAEI